MRIKPDILKSLINAGIKAKAEIKGINDEFNADRKVAEDEHGLHPGAFGLTLRLKGMEQVKRLAFLDAFDRYRDILKLDDAPQIEAFDQHAQKPRAVA